MNPNYAKKVKEEIDNLLKARFIAKVESNSWLFPIIVGPKKNFKYYTTNQQLDEVSRHHIYSFMDGYIVDKTN